jgi:anti-sigma factor RsiW
MTCERIHPLLAAFVDGVVSPTECSQVEGHLERCRICSEAVEIQRQMRRALAEHGRSAAVLAPPGLATRVAAAIEAERTSILTPDWRFRFSAFAAAALVVLTITAVALPVVTGRSTVVLAAQLALDHLKCFLIEPHDHGESISVQDAEAELRMRYGWDLPVPLAAGAGDEGRLVTVRRCLYGGGLAAHLLYTVDGQPVSLFILPGVERTAPGLSVLGQEEIGWTEGGRTYFLVASSGLGHRLGDMASKLRDGAQ